MTAILTLYSLFTFALVGRAQEPTTNEFLLPDTLKEISGLEKLNDSILIAINDGGNPPDLYLLNLSGEIVKTIHVKNAENRDWEDLTSDGEFLYIADIGNNKNDRKDLCIYKVRMSGLENTNEVSAEKISFRYSDQDSFPPKKNLRNFDAEAIAYKDGKLLLFTKNRTKPFNGISKIYEIPSAPGQYSVSSTDQLLIGSSGWMEDALTGADIADDHYYLITYNRILVYVKENGEWTLKNQIRHRILSQTETIKLFSSNILYFTDEKHPLFGGGKLYKSTF